MTQKSALCANHAARLNGSVDSYIRDFLAGESDGRNVLHALYGAVFDEPIPQRMRDLLKR